MCWKRFIDNLSKQTNACLDVPTMSKILSSDLSGPRAPFLRRPRRPLRQRRPTKATRKRATSRRRSRSRPSKKRIRFIQFGQLNIPARKASRKYVEWKTVTLTKSWLNFVVLKNPKAASIMTFCSREISCVLNLKWSFCNISIDHFLISSL